MQVASLPLGLVSTQALLISRCTCSATLLLFQKALAVIIVIEFVRIQDYEEQREGYAQDELNIRANAPSPLFSKRSVQKEGGGERRHIFGSLRY